jgi:hypothetical protein
MIATGTRGVPALKAMAGASGQVAHCASLRLDLWAYYVDSLSTGSSKIKSSNQVMMHVNL